VSLWSRLGASGRGFASILSATALAQVISFVALPLLSRLYSPEAFGVFTLVIAVVAIVAPVATLRLESAAMLAAEGSEVRAVVRNAVTSIVAVGLATFIIIQVLEAAGVWSAGSVHLSALWVSILVILTSLFSLLSQLALRERKYALVARRNLYQAVAMSVGQAAASLVSRAATGLLIGYVLGRLVALVSLWRPTREYFGRTDRGVRRAAWRTYWKFPLVFTPSALLNALGSQAPVIFIITWFGAGLGGQVGMAERIVAVPLALIGAAAGQVLEAEMSRTIRAGEHRVRRLYLRTSAMLAGVALLCVAGFILLGGWLVPILLGQEWVIAGTAVQILALSAGVRLVASPMSKIIILYQRSLANTILDVSRVFLIACAFGAIALLELPLDIALWLIYGALAATYAVTWFYGLHVASHARGVPDQAPGDDS
jgi:O-antigen/teichoic acid export membrane protein